MILDTSAAVAVIVGEPRSDRIIETLVSAPVVRIGAPTLVELGLVVGTLVGATATPELMRFLDLFELETVEFGAGHWTVALAAHSRFGKGRHPAALNMGDCMSYAVSSVAGEPLVCTGNDFPQTDLEVIHFP